MTNNKNKKDPWHVGTFEGARDQVLRLSLETTFREKLERLEESETLSLQFRAHRENERRNRQKNRDMTSSD